MWTLVLTSPASSYKRSQGRAIRGVAWNIRIYSRPLVRGYTTELPKYPLAASRVAQIHACTTTHTTPH